jgi:hypothetical protein
MEPPLTGDVVLRGGRIIDPESGVDRIADVLVDAGRVVAIGNDPYVAPIDLPADGLVVAPGFVDLHSHAQNVPSLQLQALDGVTTALELEAGVRDVRRAAAEAASEGRPVNYGFATSWAAARMKVLDGLPRPEEKIFDFTAGMDGPRWRQPADAAAVRHVLARLEDEIAAGAIGIGVLLGYAPDTDPSEYRAVARLGHRLGCALFTHARSKAGDGPAPLAGITEIAQVAALTGAQMHACHLNSTCLRTVEDGHRLVETARTDGARLTTEMYPYGAGMTAVGAAFLAPERLIDVGLAPHDLVVAASGRALGGVDELRALRASAPRTLVIIHYLDDASPADTDLLQRAIAGADVAVASDAIPFVDKDGRMVDGGESVPADSRTHPRSVGTFARFLRAMRGTGRLDLVEALRRCTLLPAQIMEPAAAVMRGKGRLQVGCDADMVAFSLDQVRDRATYAEPGLPSAGMRHVLVAGVPVVRDGILDRDTRPGRWIRSC